VDIPCASASAFKSRLALALIGGIWVALTSGPASLAEDFSLAQIEFFEKQVRPVLVQNCYECHSADAKKLRAGLRLDSRAGLLEGGDSGPAIVPGNADESLLVEAIRYASLEMPPRGKLAPEKISALIAWINDGAAWPAEVVRTDQQPIAVADSQAELFDWKRRRAQHWAWQPIRKTQPPPAPFVDWSASAIDR
jgi:mono/diheme cytochrome c family protein